MECNIEKFTINNNNFVINGSILEARVNESPVQLTGAEFSCWQYLLHHSDKLVSKREFEEEALHLCFDSRDGSVLTGSYSVYSHLASIRRKLNRVELGLGDIIINKRGFGWRLDVDFDSRLNISIDSQYSH